MLDQPNRRTQPDRRTIDQETAEFRSSVNGRLEAVAEELHDGKKRFEHLESRMDRFEQKLDANSTATTKAATDTSELLDILKSFQGGFKVLTWIGNAARPLSFIVGLITALWLLWKSR